MKSPRRTKSRTIAPESGNALLPEFALFVGKTGSGKSYAMWEKYLEWQAADPKQTLVWSPKERHDDYAGRLHCKAYTIPVEFVRAVIAGKHAVFVPTGARDENENVFDLFFCRLAMKLAVDKKQPTCLLVDEIHTVTRPNGGTQWWEELVRMGRGDGIRFLASSQRPVDVDKNFFNALSYAHVGALAYEEDAKTSAKLVRCTTAEILVLTGFDAKTRSM